MWKKGEIVWVRWKFSDTWIPGRILDSGDPLRVVVSFFGLMEPRYVPKSRIRSFESDFGTLISHSGGSRRFVNRALRAHFWNIAYGLWCSCQPPIDSPYFDKENSLPCFPLSSESALGFVRQMAISARVPLRSLAETNNSTAQILSFRRYTVDFQRSLSVYEEIRESVKLTDHSEKSDWCLDPANNLNCIDPVPLFPETLDPDFEHNSDLSLREPLPKDILCSSSEQLVDKVVQVCTWNTRRNPLTNSDSSLIKACETTAQTADHEDDGHPSRIRERCQVERSICLLNSEPAIKDVIEEGTTNTARPRPAVSAHDEIIGSDGRTVTSSKQLLPLVNVSDDKVFLAKPVSFVVQEACETLDCSVKEIYANPRNKPNSPIISAKTLNEELSERHAFNGTQENCSDDVLEPHNVKVGQVSLHITGTSNREFSSDYVGIAPAEQLQDLDTATTFKNQTQAIDNARSIGVKRKVGRDKVFANSKRKKKACQQSVSTDKPLNLHLFKDIRLAEPKCLRMKFLSRHGNIPSKAELLKRFSVFGKIDPSRTDVEPEKCSAKVVFLQSIDAVTAYQFARSKKFTLGRCKVMFRLDPFEGNSVVSETLMFEKPQKSIPSPKSCLKEHGSAGKEERRNRKVNFK